MLLITSAIVFGFLSHPALHLARKEIREAKPAFSILIDYPDIPGAADFNRAVHKIVDPLVDRFKGDLAKPPLPGAPASKAYLNGSYTAAALKSGVVSVLLEWEEYTPGAAHPTGGMASINYDGRNNRVLALSDLFQPGSDYVSRLSQLASDSLKRRPNANGALVRQGAGPLETNFKVFTLTDGTLVLHFPTYQVGTRVDGPEKVDIPLDSLHSLLRK